VSARDYDDREAAPAAAGEPLRRTPPKQPAAMTAVAALYEAAYDESVWPQALHRFCSACRADGAAIVLMHGRSRRRVVIAHAITEAALHEREVARHVFAAPTASARLRDSATEQWVDLPLPLDPPDHACLHVRMQVQPQERGRRKRMLDAFAPHVAGALCLALGRTREAAACAQHAAEADALPLGRLLVDAHDHVQWSNAAARRIVAAADGLICTDGRLLAHSAYDDALLRRMLKQVRERGDHGRLSIHRRHGRMPYALRIAPAAAAADTLFADRAPMLEVLVVSHDRMAADMAFAAASWPDLSRVERRVLERLLLGDDIEQCAQHLGIARSTTKLHIEHIFRKTGVRSRADLLRLSLLPLVTAAP